MFLKRFWAHHQIDVCVQRYGTSLSHYFLFLLIIASLSSSLALLLDTTPNFGYTTNQTKEKKRCFRRYVLLLFVPLRWLPEALSWDVPLPSLPCEQRLHRLVLRRSLPFDTFRLLRYVIIDLCFQNAAVIDSFSLSR